MEKQKLFRLENLYSKDSIPSQKKRYEAAIRKFYEYFNLPGDTPYRLFSAPGRTEIGGNHTDHNNGKVLAASVNLDIIAVASPWEENRIVIKSEGFPECSVSFDTLSPVPEEMNTPKALIRGMVSGFRKKGFQIGGFFAYTTSNVLIGSGLSSSAAFEVLIGTILSSLFNQSSINPITIAQIAKNAENRYFGKPSGVFDQMASSVGGFVAMDFKDEGSPIIEKIAVDFSKFEHALCIIDTNGSHSDLTQEYASIPQEMKAVAQHFSVDTLRRIARADVVLNINILREQYGDRAVLRALHFFDENARVDRMCHALRHNDFTAFLNAVNESGCSSYKYLQNIFCNSDPRNQALGIALNIAESVLGRKGASRVHGGGFAGAVQAFVPYSLLKEFKMDMEAVFGPNTCHLLTVRSVGGCEVTLN